MATQRTYGVFMKVGDIVVRTSEDPQLHNFPMIYMGRGLWTGWIHVYCPRKQKTIQVRKTYVKKAEI
jgi:hypothetical protein|tara:strand:- start:245 stop:445 length:201 start_codon:yes stop_codon:yes gene_type:complete